jgi:hypothetical protein
VCVVFHSAASRNISPPGKYLASYARNMRRKERRPKSSCKFEANVIRFLTKIRMYLQHSLKLHNIKCNQTLFSSSIIVTCGQID